MAEILSVPPGQAARDAMAVLAHVYLRFGRPEEAGALLAALAAIDPGQRAVRRALCLAQLRAGSAAAALATAGELLAGASDDDERVSLLRLAAKAQWRLGREAEARALLASASAAATVSIGQPMPGRRA